MSQEKNEADKTNPEIEPEASELTEEEIGQVTGGAGGLLNKTKQKGSQLGDNQYKLAPGEDKFKKDRGLGDIKGGEIKLFGHEKSF